MCISPIIKKNKKINHLSKAHEQTTPVPCGKCAQCAKDKINSWYFRIQQEIRISSSVHFVTLTYDEEHVPTINGKKTLVKRDCQLFLKRLRKVEEHVRYYLVGEYGSNTHRPHYHAIMFNIKDVRNIQKEWGNGFTFSPPLDKKGAEIRYVLKYLNKEKKGKIKDVEPEFSLMSKGIGKNYLTPQMIKYHLQSVEKSYVTGKSGEKLPMPKYYKEKIYTEESPISRAQVTKYLAQRSEEKAKENERLEVISSKMYTEEEVLRNRDIRKSGIKFERRKEKL